MSCDVILAWGARLYFLLGTRPGHVFLIRLQRLRLNPHVTKPPMKSSASPSGFRNLHVRGLPLSSDGSVNRRLSSPPDYPMNHAISSTDADGVWGFVSLRYLALELQNPP